MDSTEPQVVIDVSVSVKVGKDGASVAAVECVKDALGDDRTGMFEAFAAQENFDLTKQDQIEAAAGKFAEKYASILP